MSVGRADLPRAISKHESLGEDSHFALNAETLSKLALEMVGKTLRALYWYFAFVHNGHLGTERTGRPAGAEMGGHSWVLLLVVGFAAAAGDAAVPRRVIIQGQSFVHNTTKLPIILIGPNVVVKGPPYLPAVEGHTICEDVVNAACTATGTCKTCTTFNRADAKHMKTMGWNAIRLAVVWAGAQPRDEDSLDPDFVRRLKAVLTLCDEEGIHVMLDNHGDMVGAAGCGNGVPMWFQQRAAADLIGQPLHTGFPWKDVPGMDVKSVHGYEYCGDNETRWGEHAGDPNYNLLNECCKRLNTGGNPIQLGATEVNQKTMDYLLAPGDGRTAFVRFWRLLAEVAAPHPSAYAAELMNEPISWRRQRMFDTWKDAAIAINAVVPDMSVALADPVNGAVLPSWLTKIAGAGLAIDEATSKWIRQSSTVFYAWHYYAAEPPLFHNVAEAVKNVQAVAQSWNVPTFATEFMSCDVWNGCEAANISHTYWHYSSYCNTGAAFGNRSVPGDTFGACILGWASGESSKNCTPPSDQTDHSVSYRIGF